MNSHPRPTPANLYTTRRIGLQHWQDPESVTLFSQGKYPTKLTENDIHDTYSFFPGNYYGVHGYMRINHIKGLWYQPCYHTNHMFKDDFLYISYHHPITSCPSLYTFSPQPEQTEYDEFVSGYTIIWFLSKVEIDTLYQDHDIWGQIEEKRAWFKSNYPEDYRHEVRVPDTETFYGYYVVVPGI